MTERNYKEEFIQIYKENVKREGSEEFLKWLESTDFFTAPASTKFHGNYEGGLVEHSVGVYENLKALATKYESLVTLQPETIAICGLLHDVCKVLFYKKSSRNVKNEETGKWSAVPTYAIDDQIPLGHGEKSVILIQSKMKLSLEECVAIRSHMAGWDCATRGNDYYMNAASDKFKLVTMLQIADMEATLIEKTV